MDNTNNISEFDKTEILESINAEIKENKKKKKKLSQKNKELGKIKEVIQNSNE